MTDPDDHVATLGLQWAIKRSFIRYVARMADGQILGGPGLHMIDSSTFVFAPAESESEPDSGYLFFRGELRLQAHGGALSLRLANPRIDLTGPRAVLLIDAPDGSSPALPFVDFEAVRRPDQVNVSGWHGTDVRLTVEGVSLFAGYYGEGELFDDLIATVPER